MRKLLVILLVFSFVVRLYRISTPKTYYFDEVYHAVTAKLYARNDPSGYEWWHPAPEPNTAIEWLHPPIAKLTQAVGIKIFGENSLGWRISSAVFGVGVIVAVYLLAVELTGLPLVGLIAAFFSSIDGLLFVQSRIAMNDIHVVFFIVLSALWYAKWRKVKKNPQKEKWMLLLSGIFAGLAASTKWSGVFVLGIFWGDQLLSWIRAWKFPSFTTLVRLAFAWLIIPIAVYLLSFSQFWLQGHTWSQFAELHKQIWYYQTHLQATHSYQSTPLQWVLDIRPVWLHVDYSVPGKVGNIYNLGNPIIMYLGLICIAFMFARCIHKFSWNKWFLTLCYFMVWTPWLFSPRIMFFYHYAPAIPFLCIAFAMGVVELFKKKMLGKVAAYTCVFLATAWFVVFYPNLTAFPVPQSFANAVYFKIPSWK